MADEIPTEALEAAARAMYEAWHSSVPFEDQTDDVRDEYLRAAGPVLAAAAPYLIAEGRRQAQAELEQRAQGLLTEPVADETPALMARYERELRAKIADEIRAVSVQRLADLEGDTVRVGLTVAAKIAAGEGHDHG